VFIEKAAGEDRCNKDEGHAWRSKMERRRDSTRGRGWRVPKRVEEAKKREERKEEEEEEEGKKVKIEQARRTRIGFAQGACRCSN
jgi:hypothetical protein